MAANIVEHLGTAPCRFVTLTIRTENLSLRDAVQKLFTSFSRLRQTKFWRSRVTGGCATCEIKRTSDMSRWHPHLHLLVQGKYIPQGWLGRKWHEITGDSYIVDVFLCNNGVEAARYVTKYLSKPVPSSILRNPEHLREAIKALEGRHLVATFGDWRGKKLTETVSENTWAVFCTYRELVDRVLHGDLESRRIIRNLLAHANLNPDHLEDWVREHNALHRDLQLMLELT